MGKTIFVISDLHLGGMEGFQMCSTLGRERLARFIDWAAAQKREKEIHLVLNGDIVDFLAEEDETGFTAFVVDEEKARRKLARIAATCEDVFAALRRFTAAGNRLTLLIGNHDVELSLPGVRPQFLSLLGEGRIEYLYDNEALVAGPVLIEHGNRYDGWNMVNHGQLRSVRSQLSRGETPNAFSAQPGSELVARVMNPVKKKFAFVDLLKPETGGVVPILAVLDPGLWREAGTALRESAAAWYRGRFSENGSPERQDYVAATRDQDTDTKVDESLPENLRVAFAEADKAAADALPRGGQVGRLQEVAIKSLLKQFRAWRAKAEIAFSAEHEDEAYLAPARAHAKRFRVVIFGHTHLAKRIDLGNGALYLNTGTWADVMRIPASVYEGDEAAGVQALTRFLDDVEKNNIEAFRRQVATFARIELDDSERLQSAEVLFFDNNGGTAALTSSGIRERLA